MARAPNSLFLLLAATVAFLLLFFATPSLAYSDDSIPLSDIQSLTLYRGKMTRGRRVSPVEQLKCVGGDGCSHYSLLPDVMQCQNMGSDGYDVQWKCTAELDDKVRLGAINVGCEGYHSSKDRRVLKGSCGVEYELKLTEKGREYFRTNSKYFTYNSTLSERSWWGNLVWTVWLVVFGVIFYNFLLACFRPPPLASSAPASSVPPAPGIGFRPDAGAGYPPYGGTMYPPAPGCEPTYMAPPQPPVTGGGFWTGAATGGFLGYLFGRNRAYTPRTYWSGTAGFPPRSYGSSSYSSSSSRSSSSSTRTSTGYGGSSRR